MAKNNPFALKFDGKNTYINYGNNYNMGLNDMTISFWANIDTGYDGINSLNFVSKTRASAQMYRYGITLINTSKTVNIFMAWGSETHINYTTDYKPEYGKWFHLTSVWDRDSMLSVYINGELTKSFNISAYKNANMISNNPFMIGAGTSADNVTPTQGIFNGMLDEFKVYNYALSQNEVKNNMLEVPKNIENYLIGYWKFDEGKGTTAFDSSKSKINGTIINPMRVEGEVDLKEVNFLIQQGVEVYSIDHNYIKLGEPTSDQQLNNWFELYGYDDIGILLEDSTRRTVSSQKEQEVYETRNIDFKQFLGNVEVKELTDVSDNVSYDSTPYKLLDDIKKINNGKFSVLVKK
ncbi:MAG: LamG domain-containing protein [Clostridiaceae bacterium]